MLDLCSGCDAHWNPNGLGDLRAGHGGAHERHRSCPLVAHRAVEQPHAGEYAEPADHRRGEEGTCLADRQRRGRPRRDPDDLRPGGDRHARGRQARVRVPVADAGPAGAVLDRVRMARSGLLRRSQARRQEPRDDGNPAGSRNAEPAHRRLQDPAWRHRVRAAALRTHQLRCHRAALVPAGRRLDQAGVAAGQRASGERTPCDRLCGRHRRRPGPARASSR